MPRHGRVEETTSVDGPLVRLEVAMHQRQQAQPHHVFKPVQEGKFSSNVDWPPSDSDSRGREVQVVRLTNR